MVDSIYRTRSLGVPAVGLPDQYADGKAAKVWEIYIGSKQKRTSQYKQWIVNTLRQHECKTVLDVACGNGVDSVMLLEEGFAVMSTDASDKMLKYALKDRWNRRREPAFDKWVIEEGNWLTLADDMENFAEKPKGGFDAVICLGNSFAHLPDFEGNQNNQKTAMFNFKSLIKPGGVLVIDHRNYDAILDTGSVPAKNIYYNSEFIKDIRCSNLYVNGKATLVTMDYYMDLSQVKRSAMNTRQLINDSPEGVHHFRLSYYPHRLTNFTETLDEVFGAGCPHTIWGDFQPLGEVKVPAYYIHVIKKDN